MNIFKKYFLQHCVIYVIFFNAILQLHITIWNNNRCIRTTLGVNLNSPVKVIKVNTTNKIIDISTEKGI